MQQRVSSFEAALEVRALYSNVQWFRAGLVFEAHRLSLRLKGLLGLVTRVKKKKKELRRREEVTQGTQQRVSSFEAALEVRAIPRER